MRRRAWSSRSWRCSGWAARADRDRGVSVLWGPDGAEVKFGSKGSTVDYESLAPADEQMEQAERIRLLYVAATRAKDRLIVCNHYKAAKSAPAAGSEPLGQLLADHQPEDRPDLVDGLGPRPAWPQPRRPT